MVNPIPSPQSIQQAQQAANALVAAQQNIRKSTFSLSRSPQSWDEYIWQQQRNEAEIRRLEASKSLPEDAKNIGFGLLAVGLFIHPLLLISLVFLGIYFLTRSKTAGIDAKIERLEDKINRPAPPGLQPQATGSSAALIPPTAPTVSMNAPSPLPPQPVPLASPPTLTANPQPLVSTNFAPFIPQAAPPLFSPTFIPTIPTPQPAGNTNTPSFTTRPVPFASSPNVRPTPQPIQPAIKNPSPPIYSNIVHTLPLMTPYPTAGRYTPTLRNSTESLDVQPSEKPFVRPSFTAENTSTRNTTSVLPSSPASTLNAQNVRPDTTLQPSLSNNPYDKNVLPGGTTDISSKTSSTDRVFVHPTSDNPLSPSVTNTLNPDDASIKQLSTIPNGVTLAAVSRNDNKVATLTDIPEYVELSKQEKKTSALYATLDYIDRNEPPTKTSNQVTNPSEVIRAFTLDGEPLVHPSPTATNTFTDDRTSTLPSSPAPTSNIQKKQDETPHHVAHQNPTTEESPGIPSAISDGDLTALQMVVRDKEKDEVTDRAFANPIYDISSPTSPLPSDYNKLNQITQETQSENKEAINQYAPIKIDYSYARPADDISVLTPKESNIYSSIRIYETADEDKKPHSPQQNPLNARPAPIGFPPTDHQRINQNASDGYNNPLYAATEFQQPTKTNKTEAIEFLKRDQKLFQEEMDAYYTANHTRTASFVHRLGKVADVLSGVLLLNYVHGKIPHIPQYDFSKTTRGYLEVEREGRKKNAIKELDLSPQMRERLFAEEIVQSHTPKPHIHKLEAPPLTHPLTYTADGKLDTAKKTDDKSGKTDLMDIDNQGIDLLVRAVYKEVRECEDDQAFQTFLATKNLPENSPLHSIYTASHALHLEVLNAQKPHESSTDTKDLGDLYTQLMASGSFTHDAVFDVLATTGALYREELLKQTTKEKPALPRTRSASSLDSAISGISAANPAISFLRFKDPEIQKAFEDTIPRKFKTNMEQASQMLGDTLASPGDKIAKGHVATSLQNNERTGVLDRFIHSAEQYAHVSSTKESQQQALSIAASITMGGRVFYDFENNTQRLQFMEHLYAGNFTDINGRIYALPTLKIIDGKEYETKILKNGQDESITVLEAINKTTSEPYYYILGEKGALYPLITNGKDPQIIINNITISPDKNAKYPYIFDENSPLASTNREYSDSNLVRIHDKNYALQETLNENNERIFTLKGKDETYLVGDHGTLYTLGNTAPEKITIEKGQYRLADGKKPKQAPKEVQLDDSVKKKILNPNNSSTTVSDSDLSKKGRFAYRRKTSTHTVDPETGIEVKSFWTGVKKLFGSDANDIGMNLALGGMGNKSKHADYYKDSIIEARKEFIKHANIEGLTEADMGVEIKSFWEPVKKLFRRSPGDVDLKAHLSGEETLEVIPDGVHGHLLVYSRGNFMLIGIEKSEYGKGEHDISGKSGEKSAFLVNGKIHGSKDPQMVTWLQVPKGAYGDIRVNMNHTRIEELKKTSDKHHGRPFSEDGKLNAEAIQEKVQKPLGQAIPEAQKKSELIEDSKRKHKNIEIQITHEFGTCLEAMANLSDKQQEYYKSVLSDLSEEYKKKNPAVNEMVEQKLNFLTDEIRHTTHNKKKPESILPAMKENMPQFKANIAWNKFSELSTFVSGHPLDEQAESKFKSDFIELKPEQQDEQLQLYRTLHARMNTSEVLKIAANSPLQADKPLIIQGVNQAVLRETEAITKELEDKSILTTATYFAAPETENKETTKGSISKEKTLYDMPSTAIAGPVHSIPYKSRNNVNNKENVNLGPFPEADQLSAISQKTSKPLGISSPKNGHHTLKLTLERNRPGQIEVS